MLSHRFQNELGHSWSAHLAERRKCSEWCALSRKNLRYAWSVFPSDLKIKSRLSQHCGETPQRSDRAPVSTGQRKTEVTIYIPLFFFPKGGEVHARVRVCRCIQLRKSSSLSRCYFKASLSTMCVNTGVFMKPAFVEQQAGQAARGSVYFSRKAASVSFCIFPLP